MVKGSLPDIAVTMASGREIHGVFSHRTQFQTQDTKDKIRRQERQSSQPSTSGLHLRSRSPQSSVRPTYCESDDDSDLIVDDVDSQSILSETPDLDGLSTESSSSQNSTSQTPLDSPGPRERIKQMQVEAETRRGEFARLLEEHAQVVRQLKMMEAEDQHSGTTSSSGVVATSHS